MEAGEGVRLFSRKPSHFLRHLIGFPLKMESQEGHHRLCPE